MSKDLRTSFLKINKKEFTWCNVELSLTMRYDDKDQEVGCAFSMHGQDGTIISEGNVEKMSLENACSYLEENPQERLDIMDRRERYLTVEQAARILTSGGDYFGLDVHDSDYMMIAEYPDGSEILPEGTDPDEIEVPVSKQYMCLVTDSAGQIRETINEFFPQLKQFWKWHLNNQRLDSNTNKYFFEKIPENVINELKEIFQKENLD